MPFRVAHRARAYSENSFWFESCFIQTYIYGFSQSERSEVYCMSEAPANETDERPPMSSRSTSPGPDDFPPLHRVVILMKTYLQF